MQGNTKNSVVRNDITERQTKDLLIQMRQERKVKPLILHKVEFKQHSIR